MLANNRPVSTALLVAALLVVELTQLPVALASTCKDGWICIEPTAQGDSIELLARNLREFPVTYTLTVRTRYLRVDGPAKVTRTLQPRQAERVMTLSQVSERQKGSYRYYFDWTVGDKDATHDDDHVYDLPYASGKSYRILQTFGSRFSHTGLEEFAIDFDMPVGTPVHAARNGVVARIEESNEEGCWSDGCGKFANYIIVLHDDGTTGEYFHLDKDGALVEVGDSITQGQEIGRSGNTGHTTMPHLHFAVYRAAENGNTQSIPVRFQTPDGIIDQPRRGGRYQAI